MSSPQPILRPVLLTVLLAGWACAGPAPAPAAESATAVLELLEVPPGFRVELFAEGVTDARQMAWSPAGILYVGSRERRGPLHAVVDADGDLVGDRVVRLAEDLHRPSGIAYRDGDLYVAEVSRVIRFSGIDDRLEDPPEPEVVVDGLPDKEHHGWKFIAFGPDGHLYVPVGAPCNICEVEDPFGALLRIAEDFSGWEVIARGLRQSVGFDWHGPTGDLFFTDNGRDFMGDDRPPDELNRLSEEGQHFGFPYCYGSSVDDPHFDQRPCSELTPAVKDLGPHVAAIGMRFYDGRQFPEEYRGDVFIAEHGSWNRSERIGYRVTTVEVAADGSVGAYRDFATGWLRPDGEVVGRPSDVLVLPDGSLLVADDLGDRIFRIVYGDAP